MRYDGAKAGWVHSDCPDKRKGASSAESTIIEPLTPNLNLHEIVMTPPFFDAFPVKLFIGGKGRTREKKLWVFEVTVISYTHLHSLVCYLTF